MTSYENPIKNSSALARAHDNALWYARGRHDAGEQLTGPASIEDGGTRQAYGFAAAYVAAFTSYQLVPSLSECFDRWQKNKKLTGLDFRIVP